MPEETKSGMKWNIVVMVAVGLVGAGSTQVDRLTGRGAAKGELIQKVKKLEEDIKAHWEHGCLPSIQVRADVSALQSSDSAQQSQLDRMEQKIDNTNSKIERLIERLSG